MYGKIKRPQIAIKLLEVIFDQELKWKEQAQHTVKKATKTNLGIARLRFLRPKQMKQLYQVCVISKTDYASTVQYNSRKSNWHTNALDTVQRTALIKILSAFKTVATQTLEVESYTLPTCLRLKLRAQNTVTNLQTLSESHPIHGVLQRAIKGIPRIATGPQHPLVEALKTFDREQLEPVEVIDPRPREPWQQGIFKHIEVDINPERAKQKAQIAIANPSLVIFTDGSALEENLGAAAVMLNSSGSPTRIYQTGVGSTQNWTIHCTELIAIHDAIHLATQEQLHKHQSGNPQIYTFTILSDSQSALQALDNLRKRPEQSIINQIIDSALHVKKHHLLNFHLQWIPSHSGIRGNEIADWLAKEAVNLRPTHNYRRLASLQRAHNINATYKQWTSEWASSTKGGHLQNIDSALPAKHAKHLYNSLLRPRARILAQLRTGHSWLGTFQKRIKKSEDDRCICRARETIVHVLVDCPKLREARQKLHQRIGSRFNSISLMLGGKPHSSRHETDGKWTISKKELDAVLDFAEETQRFSNRMEEEYQLSTTSIITGNTRLNDLSEQ